MLLMQYLSFSILTTLSVSASARSIETLRLFAVALEGENTVLTFGIGMSKLQAVM